MKKDKLQLGFKEEERWYLE